MSITDFTIAIMEELWCIMLITLFTRLLSLSISVSVIGRSSCHLMHRAKRGVWDQASSLIIYWSRSAWRKCLQTVETRTQPHQEHEVQSTEHLHVLRNGLQYRWLWWIEVFSRDLTHLHGMIMWEKERGYWLRHSAKMSGSKVSFNLRSRTPWWQWKTPHFGIHTTMLEVLEIRPWGVLATWVTSTLKFASGGMSLPEWWTGLFGIIAWMSKS